MSRSDALKLGEDTWVRRVAYPRPMNVLRFSHCVTIIGLWLGSFAPASATYAQNRTTLPTERDLGSGLKRTRLFLKDGSYQVVLNYKIVGSNVVYRSAERAGESEEIPLRLVDLDATHRWEQAQSALESGTPTPPVRLDPELAREEADRAARIPLVAPNLHLPEDDSVLALDTWQGQMQLAVLQQTDGELNRQTAHNVLRAAVNPFSTAHQLVEIKGERSAVQLHVADPSLFIRLNDDSRAGEEPPAGALVVDTHGSKGMAREKVSRTSQYVIVRVDVRRGVRVVTSFNIGMLGSTKRQADVVETKVTQLPGGYWLKIVPTQPLSFGEYALIEVLDAKNVNLGVWDFGIHPTAGPNRDAIVPEAPRAPALERRRSAHTTPE